MGTVFVTQSLLLVVAGVLGGNAIGVSPFAARVVEYAPAPGQWVNDERFNQPTAALGEPFGGGLAEPGDANVVTLGGFGGSITLAFDHTVLDDPRNFFGMDAIVFGNAFWVGGDPNAHWAECATIEISLDENHNGVPDDPWFLIPGSHIVDPAEQLSVMTWDDDVGDATYPPDLASWIPAGASGVWETEAYALPVELFGVPTVTNPSSDSAVEGIYGYAEYTPTRVLGDWNGDGAVDDPGATPEDFYTVPDDPLVVGITEGSAGGDAFDIAWAIDPQTGAPAQLDGFDFIRLTAAVHSVMGVLGEKSPEIDAVADAAPDPFGDLDDDHDIDLADVSTWRTSPVFNAATVRWNLRPNAKDRIARAMHPWGRRTGPRCRRLSVAPDKVETSCTTAEKPNAAKVTAGSPWSSCSW